MKIYAKVGETGYTLDCSEEASVPDGYIEMFKERPLIAESGNVYVAQSDGTWKQQQTE